MTAIKVEPTRAILFVDQVKQFLRARQVALATILTSVETSVDDVVLPTTATLVMDSFKSKHVAALAKLVRRGSTTASAPPKTNKAPTLRAMKVGVAGAAGVVAQPAPALSSLKRSSSSRSAPSKAQKRAVSALLLSFC